MNIWNRFKASLRGAKALWSGAGYNFNSWAGRTFWGIDNSQLATNETIFSVITRLSNTVSSLPLKMYKNHDVKNTDVSDLLIDPNGFMTGWELLNKMEVARNEHGNAYVLVVRDTLYQPTELVLLENSQLTPFIDSDTNDLWYEVRTNAATLFIHNSNMIHVKHITGASRMVGISPMAVLKNSLQYDKAVQEFSLSEMEKKDSFILKYGANVSNEKQQNVIDNFKRFYEENGGIIFQEPGVTIEKIPKNYTSADTLNAEKVTRTRVANVFNVPISFLNEQGGSFSSNEQLMTQFVQMTLTPILKQYESEFNRKLLTKKQRRNGFYFKFSVNGLLRGDTAARTAFYQMMIRTAGMTPNEVRQLEDLPPSSLEQADELLVSGDLYPLKTPINERNGASTASTVEEPRNPLKGGEGIE